MKAEEAIKVLEMYRSWASDDEDTANIERRVKAAERARHKITALTMAIRALQGDLVERVYCKDCCESSPEDTHRVYCNLRGHIANKYSFCEAMRRR